MSFLTFLLYFTVSMLLYQVVSQLLYLGLKKIARNRIEKAIKSGKIKVVSMEDLTEMAGKNDGGGPTWQ